MAETGKQRSVLATDLDGTLIPLTGQANNQTDLRILKQALVEHDVSLVFVTGRHLASVQEMIERHALPQPDWILCDVGTSIHRRDDQGGYARLEAYFRHLESRIEGLPRAELEARLRDIQGLRLQEAVKQGPFKLSYYTNREDLEALAGAINERLARRDAPYSLIHSVDPFNGDGLLDLLPRGVSKAHALAWWTEHAGIEPQGIVFAGDSGNDFAAFTAGYESIVVCNADRRLAREVYDAHQASGWSNRLYFSRQPATSGVLQGCRWFGLIPAAPDLDAPQPLGATPRSISKTHFRVWAPRRITVEVQTTIRGKPARFGLQRGNGGYFTGEAEGIGPGARYQYALDNHVCRPDPASRFQPDGVHGDSLVIAPHNFPWRDDHWRGVAKRDLVIYELHIGAFTAGGTFRDAIARLAELKSLGVTALEIMPVAQTPGRWNWGYDGVGLFAVRNTYGTPDDFKVLVDACHEMGLAVILDVVYNHLGPEGNYLAEFGPYFSKKHHTPWGDALNFDGPRSKPIREFVVQNALRWLDEYHLDGLRLDAVHFMRDDSRRTILSELREEVSAFQASAGREIHLIAEANVYDQTLIGGGDCETGYDAIWCDDLMHSIYSHVAPHLRLTHRAYQGLEDLAESLRHGFIYTGPRIARAGEALRQELGANASHRYLESLVMGLQTHDAVGNHPLGQRLHQLASPACQKAAAALVLLYPAIPLIFMGEDYAASAPFPFFADFEDRRLRRRVDRGRLKEYPQHVWEGALAPSDPRAFQAAKCLAADSDDPRLRDWYRALLSLRRQWRSQGWLEARFLHVELDRQASLFTLEYSPGDSQTLIVLSRLDPPGNHPPSVELAVEGEIILDSNRAQHNWKPEHPSGPVILESNQALVLVASGESSPLSI